MKNQALFSSKDKSKKLKCRLLQFLFAALWVNEKKCLNTISYKLNRLQVDFSSIDAPNSYLLKGKQCKHLS